MMDSDDFADALRRELHGAAVPHDDDHADAMIRTAIAANPVGGRNWAAPLAAAAAVVVVGGGVAVVAASHDGGGSPSGGGPAACPTVQPAGTVAPSISSATPRPFTGTSRGQDQSGEIGPPASYLPVQTVPTASASTQAPAPSTPTAAPSDYDACTAAPTSSAVDPLPTTTAPLRSAVPQSTTIKLHAGAGVRVTVPIELRESSSSLYVVQLIRLSGQEGTIAASDGPSTYFVQDIAKIAPGHDIGYTPRNPTQLTLNCSGTTACSIVVTVSPTVAVGSGIATATASASPSPSR